MNKLAEQAQKDLDALFKLGTAKRGINWEMVKTVAAPILATLGVSGLTGLGAYYWGRKDRERHIGELKDSFGILSKNPSLTASPEKFIERFGELTVISPTIAKSPSLAAKLLQNKIDTGFDVDDIHKLTAIEQGSSRQGNMSPTSAGVAGGMSALRTLVQTFGPTIYKDIEEAGKTRHDKLTKLEKDKKEFQETIGKSNEYLQRFLNKAQAGKMEKKSAQIVSDECLGQMLAERYVLFKTAGVGDLLMKGTKNLGNSLAILAPALALGGTVELVRQAIESRRNAALESEADRNFKVFMRENDVAKGNPQMAGEAFNTLKAFAPSLAARPLVANTFIEHIVTQGRLAPETVQQIAEAENEIRGIGMQGLKKPSFGFISEFKDVAQTIKSHGERGARPKPRRGYLK